MKCVPDEDSQRASEKKQRKVFDNHICDLICENRPLPANFSFEKNSSEVFVVSKTATTRIAHAPTHPQPSHPTSFGVFLT